MGTVSEAAADRTDLRAGTPVIAGGDPAAGAVGVGAVREGVVSLVVGTSGVVFATTRARYRTEGRLHAFCHAAPGRWHLMGVHGDLDQGRGVRGGPAGRTEPDRNRRAAYDDAFERYRTLYPTLKPTFDAIVPS